MYDINHVITINKPAEDVYKMLATAEGLDKWWTLSSKGKEGFNEVYQFYFGEKYDWRGKIVDCLPHRKISFEIIKADKDWTGTLLQFTLNATNGNTEVDFSHKGWKENNDHYQRSIGCWLNYLKVMKLNLEEGTFIPYEKRNEPIV